jgi:hypothetical protein
MARYVLTAPVTVAGSGYSSPARVLPKGAVVELSAAEVTTVGGGNLRSTTARDALGEGAGASNSD